MTMPLELATFTGSQQDVDSMMRGLPDEAHYEMGQLPDGKHFITTIAAFLHFAPGSLEAAFSGDEQ